MEEARKPEFKVGDRVVPKTFTRVVFEIVEVIEVILLPGTWEARYKVKPCFRPSGEENKTFTPIESEIRLATDEEVARAVTRRVRNEFATVVKPQ
jgi:hypothetical protein